jgi:putative aldouronate transport system permease protein
VLTGKKTILHNGSLLKRILIHKYFYLLLIPGFIQLFIFSYVPMYGVLLAFKDFSIMKGIMGSPWVGFKYFAEAFNTGRFWQVLQNTLVISFMKILTGFWVPIVISLLLNELYNRTFKRIVQTVIYLPHFISWIMIYGMVSSLFAADGGIINNLIIHFGGTPRTFLIEKNSFMAIIYGTEIWKSAGWGTILYLAALSGIDQEVMDAATIDGANRLQRILHVNLPAIAGTVIIMLILRIGSIMSAGFDQIFNFTNPAVSEVADIIDTYVYNIGMIKSDFSFAAAIGLFNSVISCTLMLSVNWLSRRLNQASIY